VCVWGGGGGGGVICALTQHKHDRLPLTCRVFGHLRVEIVAEHAKRSLGEPGLARDLAAARCTDHACCVQALVGDPLGDLLCWLAHGGVWVCSLARFLTVTSNDVTGKHVIATVTHFHPH
jgi:hypothetical protein